MEIVEFLFCCVLNRLICGWEEFTVVPVEVRIAFLLVLFNWRLLRVKGVGGHVDNVWNLALLPS